MDEKWEKPESFVFVVFEGINSVNIKNMQTEGVSPLQLMAISEYLSILAKNELLQQINERLEMQKQQNLSVPKQQILTPRPFGGK